MHGHQPRHCYANFWLKVSCALFLLLLTGCSSMFNGANASSTPLTTPTPTRHALIYVSGSSRSDGSVANPLAIQLAQIQSIMAGMTLDQKLAQLIIVEYLGNTYEPTLQYMIQQGVGGFLYQASNTTLTRPTIPSIAWRLFRARL
jgi:beta-N-acetylhexosaminidase